MPENNDYRNLIEEKFSHINEVINLKFDKTSETLESILKQTTATNGRVREAEGEIEALKEISVTCKTKLDKLETDMDNYQKSQADLNFIQRHPKLTIFGIVAAVIFILFSFTGLDHLLFEPNKVDQSTMSTIEDMKKDNQEYQKKMLNYMEEIDRVNKEVYELNKNKK